MARLVVVGQGYVGLPLALAAAAAGHDVVGFDVDQHVVEQLSRGRSHVGDVDDTELAAALAQDRYRATSDPAVMGGADTVVVCVPTPLDSTGAPDLSAVLAAAETISRELREPATVVLESTTHPGTTNEVFLPVLLRHGHRLDETIFVAFSAERIDPGNTHFDVVNTPKVVGGVTPASAERARAFYASFIDTVVLAKGAREAEMAKMLENTFRHVNIALVNEMLRFCNDLDVDLWDAIRCAGTKPFGFMPFRPGPGVGGHCIPVDPIYLSHRVRAELGYAFRMVELAEEINQAAPHYVVRRAWSLLNDAFLPARGSQVLLLGVTYKPGVGDCRDSPADPIFRGLHNLGCRVSFHDFFVSRWRPVGTDMVLDCTPDLDEAVASTDLVVLLQPHREYALDKIAVGAQRVLDTCGLLDVRIETVTRL